MWTVLKSLKGVLKSLLDIIMDKKYDFWNSIVGWTVKLYSLTVIIPLAATIILLAYYILGIPTEGNIMDIWFNFYIYGSFLGVESWRWHILLLLLSFIINALTVFDEKQY